MTRLTTEVAVVGAGPAGCVFATRMAQLGYEVCVIEREPYPRSHLGESLTPGVMPMLASFGAAAAAEAAGSLPVDAVSTNWDGAEAWRDGGREQGRLVDRGAFDAALLARAAEAGVRVIQPARVRRLVRAADGWRVRIESPGGPTVLYAGFLADGSGRAAGLGGRRRATGPRTIAIYGYWTGTHLPRRPRIEAGEREWFWGVPIPDGTYNTLVFVDGARLRSEPRRTLEQHLRALLERSALLRDAPGALLRGPARAADATPYLAEDRVGARHIRIGDAALAIDPLSSSGVQKAVQTALAGAIVANTLLRRPEAGEAALRFYRDSVGDAAARHRAWAAGHYATAGPPPPPPFWTERAGAAPSDGPAAAAETPPARPIDDDVPLRLSADARWDEVPCLGPWFVEVRAALRHPRIEGPVAYLAGQHLAPLLRDLPQGLTSRQLARAWSGTVPSAAGLALAHWLSGHGVLEPCTRP